MLPHLKSMLKCLVYMESFFVGGSFWPECLTLGYASELSLRVCCGYASCDVKTKAAAISESMRPGMLRGNALGYTLPKSNIPYSHRKNLSFGATCFWKSKATSACSFIRVITKSRQKNCAKASHSGDIPFRRVRK